MKYIKAMVAALVMTAMISGAAAAACAMLPDMAAVLSGQMDQHKRHSGLTKGAKSVVEIWVNDRTGAWSAVVIMPDGVACLVEYGEHWQDFRARNPHREPLGTPG